jgi:hypothetical protein
MTLAAGLDGDVGLPFAETTLRSQHDSRRTLECASAKLWAPSDETLFRRLRALPPVHQAVGRALKDRRAPRRRTWNARCFRRAR